MSTHLLLIIFKLMHDYLGEEIEKIKNQLPESCGHDKGTGTILDPYVKVFPILDGLYSLITTIDNIVYMLEKNLSRGKNTDYNEG